MLVLVRVVGAHAGAAVAVVVVVQDHVAAVVAGAAAHHEHAVVAAAVAVVVVVVGVGRLVVLGGEVLGRDGSPQVEGAARGAD